VRDLNAGRRTTIAAGVIVAIGGASSLFIACTVDNRPAGWHTVVESTTKSLIQQDREQIDRLTQERDLYRAQSARAHELLTKATREASASFVKGIKLGHSTVKCLPFWPPIMIKDGH
jgi:hypothetical protein